MSAQVLRGAPVAAALDERTAAEAAVLQDRGVAPTLALLRVGEDPSDLAYERSVVKRAQQVGVAVRGVALAAEASQASLMAAVQDINQDPAVHGCLFFRPLPAGLDEPALCDALAAPKDVDGGGLSALGALFTGRGGGFAPCTAQACLELLDYYGIDLKGKRVVVVGRSLVVGKPVAMLALARHATVTICHSRTQGLAALCRQADVLVACTGRGGMLTSDYLAPGQVVIDVGIALGADGRLCGDLDPAAAAALTAAYTPVPGGVGSVTTSVLLKHTVAAATAASKRP